MRTIQLFQLGLGNVGQALARQILAQNQHLATRYGFSLSYRGLVERSGVVHTGQELAPATVEAALAKMQARQPLTDLAEGKSVPNWSTLLPSEPCIIIDVTAADGMEEPLTAAVAEGHRVVLSNKRPLAGPYQTFCALTGKGATRYEATVGAGLPIINTLQNLLDSGDTLTRIEASVSGTLGYLCSALEEGEAFSTAVKFARSKGWTEPDPRDDLSGKDVARKALILGRTCGFPWEIDQVPSEPLFPSSLAPLTVAEFMERLTEVDAEVAKRFAQAKAQQKVLRYVATVTPEGAKVGLREFPLAHPMAALRGPDNLFVFTTARYTEQPLGVRGPGAGLEVTAAGVLGDIIAAAREM